MTGSRVEESQTKPGMRYYSIIAKHSGKVLDVSHASHADGVPFIQWPKHKGDSQLFRLEDSGDGRYFSIIAKHSGKVLDVGHASHADAATFIQWPKHKGGSQLFCLQDSG